MKRRGIKIYAEILEFASLWAKVYGTHYPVMTGVGHGRP
jgi:hypothetical protein